MKKIMVVAVTLSLLITCFAAITPPAAAYSVNGIDRVSWLADDFRGRAATLTIKEDGDFPNDFRDGDDFRIALRPGVKWLRDGSTYTDENGSPVNVTLNGAPISVNMISDTTMGITIPDTAGITNNDSVDVLIIPLYVDLNGVTGDIYLQIDPMDSAVSGNINGGSAFSTVYDGTNASGNQPLLKETGARGWSDIGAALSKASAGSNYTIRLYGNNTIPPSFYQAIRGKDISIRFDLGTNYDLDLNGVDITSGTANGTDVNIKMDTNKIPKSMLDDFSDIISSRQFTVTNPGSADFNFTLIFTLDKKGAGREAALFFKDGDALTRIAYASVESDGKSAFKLKLAEGDYIALIADEKVAEPTEPPAKPAEPPALPPAPPVWVNPYDDVSATDWYYAAVQYVSENGIFSGTSNSAFDPDLTISRGMLVTALWRLSGQPTAEAAAFDDAPAGEWFADAVSWAAANGIIEGYGDNLFKPNDPVNREQIAAIFYRYAGYSGVGVNLTESGGAGVFAFADWPAVSPWAQIPLTWCYDRQIIQGKSTPTGFLLDPQGLATRAEAAAIFSRFPE